MEPTRTTIIISISSHFFHESVRINSAALYKIRLPRGDGVPTYLNTIRNLSELHGHIEILVHTVLGLTASLKMKNTGVIGQLHVLDHEMIH